MSVIVLPINKGSDGDGRRRPKTEGPTRNDEYWLQRMGEEWAKALGKPKANYRLNALPDGYGGWEKGRGGDSKHVDRYLFGHVKGPARSIPDIMPHFIYLMEHGSAFGCNCKMCVGGSRASGVGAAGEKGSSKGDRQSPHFAPSTATASRAQSYAPLPPPGPKLIGRPKKQQDVEMAPLPRRKQVDEEGTPDALRMLLDKLKTAGTEGKIDEPIFESLSPEWRTGHTMLMETLREWPKLPSYVPRVGELVLFVRSLASDESLGWDKDTWRVLAGREWADKPRWEAGVITQMPTEAITDDDLKGVPVGKEHNVVGAGFRVEPLPQPNSVDKSLTRKHKYVPLHAIRPLALWKECLSGVEQPEWHPTVSNALIVASSFCVLGKYHFKGTWPEATVFAQAVYLGPEIVAVGDAVRLHNKTGDMEPASVTDIMVITAIKVRIVNLDDASDDDLDNEPPYNTCTHISGRVYTQDPTRSFDGIGKLPISAASPLFPIDLGGLGTWYHVTDPKKPKARIEVPFHRVIGRCYESAALEAWFTPPSDVSPPSGFQAVNSKPPTIQVNDRALDTASSVNISRGLQGILEARAYSVKRDIRIAKDEGKTWFWADTRVEQLDIQEVNSRFVGARNEMRSKDCLARLRKALEALDGKIGGLEGYNAARREREEKVARKREALEGGGSGLVAGSARVGGGEARMSTGEGEKSSMEEEEGVSPEEEVREDENGGQEEEDAMEVDEQLKTDLKHAVAPDVMNIDDDDDEDVDAGAALAAFKMASTAKKPGQVVVNLDSDDEMT
ncbi:hypothetical protein B0A54_03703 [Friedmanniomyces endolithicus]|uniref:Cryptic loci regulator 2 N-terminal domain-containing protein n=1 Tax=Friedmanniomyces endolithicus TaxID=329885 RepID=A0A4U0VCM9_9PEZI|nr:hypothetical protein LTS09_015373 [Friedmanniomyces endolithicus]TKA46747.1 hypothetical protein B0A54_03703 [Friedmanniomyces endolithicus]